MNLEEADVAEYLKEIDRQILAHYLTLDETTGDFLYPPKDDRELLEFIHLAFGLKLPETVQTPGHSSPAQFVCDLFFERVKNAIGFANRTGGKTLAVAVLNLLDMVYKKNCEIASAGAVKDQADKCYRYFLGFLSLPWFKEVDKKFLEITNRPLLDNSIQSHTTFNNGSMLQVITGNEKGLRSPHPHKARLDEIDMMDMRTLNVGLSMARSGEGIRGQNVFTSTRQFQEGPMQYLLDTAIEKGIAVYQWNVWETVSTCHRRCFNDAKHGTCPIYNFCGGRAHSGAGFFSIDDFIDKVRLIDREMFATEWLNSKPAKDRLVYYMWDNERHVMNPQKLNAFCGFDRIQMDWRRVCGIDFGSSPGHPFVYIKLAEIPGKNAWIVFYEYVAEQRLIRDHAAAIKCSPFYMNGDFNFSDWDAQDRLELKSNGVFTRQAFKDVNMGCDHVAALLRGTPKVMSSATEEQIDIPRLFVWHECRNTISEFGKYHWPIKLDGKPDRSGVPAKEYDHCMDAIRYALYSLQKRGGAKYRSYSIRGI